jgi:hypothetical protein
MISLAKDWNGQYLFIRPALVQATMDCTNVYANIFSPHCSTLRFAVQSKHVVPACIAQLFFHCSPRTVVWRISTIIVQAFKRMGFRRTFAHVSQERFKRILPFCANSNTASAIIFKRRVTGIQTALSHMIPDSVFWRLRFSMSFLSLRDSFFLQTSATLCMFCSQTICRSDDRASATTYTYPLRMTMSILYCLPQDKKSCKCLAGQILKIMCRHILNLLLLRIPEKREDVPACQETGLSSNLVMHHEDAPGTPGYSISRRCLL